MKALLRGGSCIVGCTLTRASRRLQKRQQPPRRLPSPVTKRAWDLQRALTKKNGTSLYLRARDLHTGLRQGQPSPSPATLRAPRPSRAGSAGEGSSEIRQTGTPLYVGRGMSRKASSRDSRYLFGSGLAVRSAEPQHCERRQGQRERPFEAVTRRRLRRDRARITEVAAAEELRVGIEDLFVDSARRYADAVSLAHHRREIAHA